jgi:hypothetical protein
VFGGGVLRYKKHGGGLLIFVLTGVLSEVK